MKNKNILIVINNGIIGLDIKKQLNGYGYNTELMNPKMNEKIKEKLNNGIQLIILEKSADDEGIKCAAKLARHYNLPAIYLSTDNDSNVTEQNGFRILMMPFGADDLKEVVKKILGDN